MRGDLEGEGEGEHPGGPTVKTSPLSPRVTSFSWARIEVEGHGSFKDAKLFPGGAREWNWNETGTQHIPGIQPGDVEELLQYGITSVVLAMGVNGRLRICPETMTMLRDRGVAAHAHRTEEAVRLYNTLRESEPVGALIHSTC